MTIIRNALVAAVLAGACLLPQAASAAPIPQVPRTWVFGAANGPGNGWTHPAFKPREFDFGADGGLQVLGLRWDHWRSANAHASGFRRACHLPSCLSHPAKVTLYDRERHGSRFYFKRMTVRWHDVHGTPRIMRLVYSIMPPGILPFWH